MNIHQKTILVTGAASGLGAATADYFETLGAHVVRVDKNATQKNIQACDVTSEASVKKILDAQPDIHGVVHCAGIVHGARIVGKAGAMPLEDFSRVIQINLIGTFNVLRLCAAKISAQSPVNDIGERGVIISTASVAAFEGQLGQTAYSASKGGVAAMVLPAARELAQFGIRVLAIAPGVMETPMMAGMSEKVREGLCADVLFPKKLGDPNAFAKLCAHIIENDYLNGTTIRLDAGLRMR